MFVALRDLRHARGRFALMGAVVALITLLVVFLAGLTAGLGQASASAISSLPAERIVFGGSGGAEPTVAFSESSITQQQFAEWRQAPGVGEVQPLDVGMTRLSARSGAESVSALGTPASLMPPLLTGVYPSAGQLAVSHALAASMGVAVGASVRLGARELRLSGIVQDRSYGHAPCVWAAPEVWRQAVGGDGVGFASVLVVSGGTNLGIAQAAARTGTLAVSPGASLAGIDGYSAEHGSLLLIQVFLFVVSALVIGAFFTVWTMQRKADVAVLKAIGGSNSYLLRDALVQALVVLVVGTVVGGALAAAGGILAARSVPFVLSVSTALGPMAAMVLLGAIGAALAIQRITPVDPLTALGSAR